MREWKEGGRREIEREGETVRAKEKNREIEGVKANEVASNKIVNIFLDCWFFNSTRGRWKRKHTALL